MPAKQTLRMRHRQQGVTIVELMISILLGLLLLAAATAMTTKSMVMNGDTIKSVKLNQDLDSVIQVMVNDIRRAGYSGGVFDYADNEDLNIVNSGCVLYGYDHDQNGSLDTYEKFGFRLTGSEIEMRTACTTGATCATSCTTGTWVPLTDDSRITVTTLTFDSVSSKCFNLTDNANVVALSNDNNYWETTTDGTLNFPCIAASSTGVTTYVKNSSDVYVGGTFVAPATGDRLIETRQVNVEIDARLTNDATMVKNQQVGINVRNNHIRVIP